MTRRLEGRLAARDGGPVRTADPLIPITGVSA
jgi:hypothetical protein